MTRLAWLTLWALAACTTISEPVDNDGDGFGANIDCNDDDPTVHPSAPEFCDGIDQDCNGIADEDYAEDAIVWWLDADADAYGKLGPSVRSCTAPSGYIDNSADCDDSDAAVNPDADETCDAQDRNCDGDPTAGAVDAPSYYIDADADGSAGTEGGQSCVLPPDTSATADDCDDDDPLVYPGAPELCDRVDNDCDGGLGFDAVVSVDADSIAAAVASVDDGGVVCVPAGTWPAAVTLADKAVTVVGESRAATTLTGGGTDGGTRFAVGAGGTLTLEDVGFDELRSGEAPRVEGGALTLRRVLLDRALIHTGDSETVAPFLSVADGRLALEDVELGTMHVIRTSRATGLFVHAVDSEVSVDDVYLHDIYASGVSVWGLFHLDGSSLTGGDLRVVRSQLGHPSSLSYGGLVLATNASAVDLDGLQVSDFSATHPYGGVFAAEFGSTLTLDHVDVFDLQTTDGAGAFMFTFTAGEVQVDHLSLVGSTAGTTRGWVHPSVEGASLTFRNVLSAGNELIGSGRGGWFDCDNCYGTVIRVENGTFMDSVTSGVGTFALLEDLFMELVNTHIGPAFDGSREGVITAFGGDDEAPCGIQLDHVSIGFNESDLVKGYFDPDGIFDVISLTDEVTAPGFVSVTGEPETWDLHLLATSPLVDAGTKALDDPDGTRSDIGAYGGPGGDGW